MAPQAAQRCREPQMSHRSAYAAAQARAHGLWPAAIQPISTLYALLHTK